MGAMAASLEAPDDKRDRTASVCVAVIVIVGWAAVVIAVGALWVWVWPSKIGIVLAAMSSVIVVATRPRLATVPANCVAVDLSAFPQLRRLIDDIGDTMGAPRLGLLGFDGEINASTVRVGYRQRVLITIGLPLREVLSADERVALLAHEIAHEVNGDLGRSGLVGASIDMLQTWAHMMHPGPWSMVSQRSIVDQSVWVLLWPPAMLLYQILLFQLRVTSASNRTGELLADQLAADAAGTEAVARMLERLILSISIEFGIAHEFRPATTFGRQRGGG